MPSLRDIRRRIGSVKSTQQITKAMKMVAAAKLRRAQEAITKARPYALLLEQSLNRVASRATSDEGAAHPLLASRPVKRVELVVITSDRGLAGGFNSNVVRRAQRFMVENADKYEEIAVSTIGKKGRDSLKARKVVLRKDYTGVHAKLSFEKAHEIAGELSERFLSGEVDAVFLLFNEFKSAIAQIVRLKQFLPVETGPAEATASVDFLYEPSRTRAARRHRAAPPRRAGVAGAARFGRQRARRAHDRHGGRHQERGRDDRRALPPVQPRAAGLHHQGAEWRS